VEPITHDLVGKNGGVLAEPEVRELVGGLGGGPCAVQGGGEGAVLAVFQRQVNCVPASDEDFDAAGHRASLELDVGEFEWDLEVRVTRGGAQVNGSPVPISPCAGVE
jgi:hypothetical protein